MHDDEASPPVDHQPLITIGITCCREGDWLLDCWRSVLAQSDDRWVAVLVMDGTTDARTREIFAELTHPKLRKFAMPGNVGPYPARNKAFELTETPYHFYLDGDDQLPPNAVWLVLREFEHHPETAFVYGDYECFGDRTEICRYPKRVDANDFVGGQPTPGGCAYARRTWETLGGFCTELARGNADYDFFIGAFEAGLVGHHCGEVFYRQRVGNPTSVSRSYNRRYHKTHEIIVRRHAAFFRDLRRRARFLALGYRRAALAHASEGRSWDAARLARRALSHGLWRDLMLWNIWRAGYLPVALNRMAEAVWSFRRRLRSS
jgi:glycosyltransferase involved in cell wall biosynthesis